MSVLWKIIFLLFLNQAHADAQSPDEKPGDSSGPKIASQPSDEELDALTNPPESASQKLKNFLDSTPPILYDIVLQDIIYGINQARGGVYLICGNDPQYSWRSKILPSDIYFDIFYPSQPLLSRDGANFQIFANLVTVKTEFLSQCYRALERIIKVLPSIKLNKRLEQNIVFLPWKGDNTEYITTSGNQSYIAVGINQKSEQIHESIMEVLSPIADINDKTLEQIIIAVLSKFESENPEQIEANREEP